jgi:hypothetical protein
LHVELYSKSVDFHLGKEETIAGEETMEQERTGEEGERERGRAIWVV